MIFIYLVDGVVVEEFTLISFMIFVLCFFFICFFGRPRFFFLRTIRKCRLIVYFLCWWIYCNLRIFSSYACFNLLLPHKIPPYIIYHLRIKHYQFLGKSKHLNAIVKHNLLKKHSTLEKMI